jgi:ADP-heptose:LPS heptosyltransferase
MVTTLPMIKALAKDNPGASIDLWCNPSVGEWMEGQDGLHRVWKGQAPPIEMVYDVVIEGRGRWRTLLYALRSGVRARRDRGTIRLQRRLVGKPQLHEWDINLVLAGPWLKAGPEESLRCMGLDQPGQSLLRTVPAARTEAELFLNRHDLTHYAILHTGARKLLRRWSLHRWAELARRLHVDMNLDIVFVGTPDEQGDVERIRAMLDFETHTWMEGRPVSRLISLLGGANLMVGNESGPMHLAVATGCPTVGLFGPGEPEIFSPKVPFFKALHKKLPCNPCAQIRCVFPDNPCMNRIQVEEVLQAVLELRPPALANLPASDRI